LSILFSVFYILYKANKRRIQKGSFEPNNQQESPTNLTSRTKTKTGFAKVKAIEFN